MRKTGKTKSPARPRNPSRSAKSPPSFWRGILLGGAIAGAAAYFGPSLLRQFTGDSHTSHPTPPKAKIVAESTSSSRPGPAAAPKPAAAANPSNTSAGIPSPAPVKPASGIPLFRRPDAAAALAVRAGLGESYPGSLRWKKSDALGWNAFASLTLPTRSVSTRESASNSITALLESDQPDHIQRALLTANLTGPRGEAETLEKFRTLALTFLSETGCPATRQLVDAIGLTAMETDTPTATYTLKKIPLLPASRWELTILSK